MFYSSSFVLCACYAAQLLRPVRPSPSSSMNILQNFLAFAFVSFFCTYCSFYSCYFCALRLQISLLALNLKFSV